jgi:hypothetical protein
MFAVVNDEKLLTPLNLYIYDVIRYIGCFCKIIWNKVNKMILMVR